MEKRCRKLVSNQNSHQQDIHSQLNGQGATEPSIRYLGCTGALSICLGWDCVACRNLVMDCGQAGRVRNGVDNLDYGRSNYRSIEIHRCPVNSVAVL